MGLPRLSHQAPLDAQSIRPYDIIQLVDKWGPIIPLLRDRPLELRILDIVPWKNNNNNNNVTIHVDVHGPRALWVARGFYVMKEVKV